MKQNIKRQVYLVAFTLLGLTLGILVEAMAELYYTRLLLSDFNGFNHGLSWSDLMQVRDFFAVLVVLLSGWWGYRAGIYWWHEIYELKRFRRKHWFKS